MPRKKVMPPTGAIVTSKILKQKQVYTDINVENAIRKMNTNGRNETAHHLAFTFSLTACYYCVKNKCFMKDRSLKNAHSSRVYKVQDETERKCFEISSLHG